MKTSKFKMTEIGHIPEDWEVKPLGEMFSFKNGFNTDAKYYGTGTSVASVLEALSDKPLEANGIRTKVTADAKAQDAFSLRRGDLIFVRSSETLEDVGRSNVYLDDAPAMFGGFVIRGRPKDDDDSKFVNYVLKTPAHRERVSSQGAGAQHYNIGQAGLERVLVTIPPLPEQKRIAAALSDVDEYIAALVKLIEKKRAVKQGAMQELLEIRNEELGMRNVPRRRLPGFTGAWVEKRLGEIGVFSKGLGISRDQATSGKIPAVRYGEIYTTHNEYIKKFESFISREVANSSKRLKTGDILFACSGETKEEIAKCAAYIEDEEAYAGGDLIILSPSVDFDSLFLGFALNSAKVAAQKSAAGQGDAVVHIRKESLEAVVVEVPPTVAEQRAIAAVLSDMDAEIAALEEKKAKIVAIKQGMMQELLTGKTRLEA